MFFDEFLTVLPSVGLPATILCVFGGIWLAYNLCMILYNLSPLHPLSHIPGPLLARATYLPEMYYDLVKHGRYTWEIAHMHEKYGPIIRINPNEVHCNDINLIDDIYASSHRRRDKAEIVTRGVPYVESGFATTGHELHKLRRAPVVKFFSRAMIARLEDDVHRLAQSLCDKLLSSVDGPIDSVQAYSCFTSDIISMYCFGECFGFLEQKDWTPNFHIAELAVLKPIYFLRYFPMLTKLYGLADHLVDYLPKDLALFIQTFRIDVPNHVRNTQLKIDSGVTMDRATIFNTLLQLPPGQKNLLNSNHEAMTLLAAGTETTSWTLTVITYYLLTQPETLSKLTKELGEAVEDPKHLPKWNELESLPYLQAVIQEGLRLSYGVTARSPRIPTDEDLIYTGEWKEEKVRYVIPRGYPIGMSSALVHHDESAFPNSYAFNPERWLDPESKKVAERGFMPFSRGSRNCVGMNLAICELHVALAALTLRVIPRMRLFETTEEDVLYDYDLFIPQTKKDSKGVRVTIS
ncbi:cytochrome P450 [Hypoxylon trugodes]|uniref:cytochrome P450 n=1 Tax=Hypoxylon trugodes TaxID=326681 RepID=UPI0021947040|nr:cytochrome P450 [Hypoxylon trugodes]KAI1387579.1 cytochrome P450 [Hypoxylon trugodes]